MASSERFSLRGVIATAARSGGIDRTLVYMLLARCWSLTAGPVSLIVVARTLSVVEQGFYYTFWSVLGLWVFFDLGLSLVLIQFASHERAALRIEGGVMTGDAQALERLASLLRLAVRWYGAAAALMLVVVLPAGLLFFGRYAPPGAQVNWVWPWVLVVLTSVVNLLLGPLATLLEGSGFVRDVALMRLLQAIFASTAFWCSLALGAELYSAFVLNGVTAAFSALWISARHRRFFASLGARRPRPDAISWREEIWPFQWRFAISWMASYFMFQLFNPILFAAHGPDAAGRMGMSLMMTTALALFAQSWINARSVDYGAMVASRTFEALDRSFRHSLVQSTAVFIVLSATLVAVLHALRAAGHPIGERVLPTPALSLLLISTILAHVVNAQAAYLRAYKREAFLPVYATMAVVAVGAGLMVVKRFGATGVVAALLASVAVIGVGWGSMIFRARRLAWRNAASTPADDVDVG